MAEAIAEPWIIDVCREKGQRGRFIKNANNNNNNNKNYCNKLYEKRCRLYRQNNVFQTDFKMFYRAIGKVDVKNFLRNYLEKAKEIYSEYRVKQTR